MLAVGDWRNPQDLAELYLAAHANYLVGAILIPGRYGLKDPNKGYPEYWHWPEYKDGNPAGFLEILNDSRWPKHQYGFHEQLWCGVFAQPDKSDELNFLCTQLEAHTIKPVIEAMLPTCAEIYASPFDLYDLFEEMDMPQHLCTDRCYEWQNPSTLEPVVEYLVSNYFRDLRPQAIALPGYSPI